MYQLLVVIDVFCFCLDSVIYVIPHLPVLRTLLFYSLFFWWFPIQVGYGTA